MNTGISDDTLVAPTQVRAAIMSGDPARAVRVFDGYLDTMRKLTRELVVDSRSDTNPFFSGLTIGDCFGRFDEFPELEEFSEIVRVALSSLDIVAAPSEIVRVYDSFVEARRRDSVRL